MDLEDRWSFTPADERRALAHACVTEQIPALMAAISRARPFLIEDYLGYARDNWVIFVGYPLQGSFDPAHCERLIARVLAEHRPEYLWFIGPEVPAGLAQNCRARQSDQYLRLDLAQTAVKASLQREVNQAAKKLTVAHGRAFTPGHQALADELLEREKLPPMIAELYRAMPAYVDACDTALVLDARDRHGKLSAFFVIECAAEAFDTYLLGCHSKRNYVAHASDLLFSEMLAHARERGKPALNLGLGVNPGIRRFKMKWGGKAYLNYEFCECHYGIQEGLSILDDLLGRGL
jgi:hypothetical protein